MEALCDDFVDSTTKCYKDMNNYYKHRKNSITNY